MKYLFLILILFLPSQLGKHWWPQWSLVEGVRVDYLSPTIYLTDLILGTILVIYFLGKISKIKYQKSPPEADQPLAEKIQIKRQKFWFYGFSIFILCLMGYWILTAERRWLAVYWLARYLEIPLVAFLTIKIRRIRGERKIRREIITALAIAVLWSAGLGIAQMILGRTTGWFWWLGERSFTAATPGIATMTVLGREILRSYATFGHPNALGGFVAAATLSLLQVPAFASRSSRLTGLTGRFSAGRQSSKFLPRRRAGKVQSSLLVLIGIIGVGLTGSRGAILGLVIAKLLNCYIVSEIRRVKNWGLLGIVIVSSLVIGYRWNNTNKLVIFANESSTERNILNHAAIKMWQNNWLMGVGPGQFLVELPEYLPAGFYKIQPVHNVFLLVLAEFGIIGLSIIIITIIKIIKSAVGAKSAGLKWAPVLAVIFVTGMVDHYWLTAQQNRLLLGVILGMMVGDLKSNIQKTEHGRTVRR